MAVVVAVAVSIAISVKEAMVIIVMIIGKYGSTWNKITPKTFYCLHFSIEILKLKIKVEYLQNNQNIEQINLTVQIVHFVLFVDTEIITDVVAAADLVDPVDLHPVEMTDHLIIIKTADLQLLRCMVNTNYLENLPEKQTNFLYYFSNHR